MTIKIVTDSLSDITGDLAKQLDVSVVPLYVRFGEQVYKDRIDMTTEEFYRRLVHDSVYPTTTQPTPADFAAVYEEAAKHTGEILVACLSGKLSGTYQSALQAKNSFKGKARIEVIDTRAVIMGLGLIVIEAVKAARAGAKLDELVEMVNGYIPHTFSVMAFDTLKYLSKGGRIGKAQSFLGSVLSVKPVLWLKDGEVHPITRVRSRAAGIDYLYNFVAGFKKIDGLAVEHATTPADADALVERLNAVYPKEKIYRSTVSPVFGTYGGPHVLSVSVLESRDGK
jgi:DegV family protein with EDD domain